LGVADRVEDREADPAVAEDSVAVEEDLEVGRREEWLAWREVAQETGREAGRV
jgi:hypothetical protein